jgi:hypothetical protein
MKFDKLFNATVESNDFLALMGNVGEYTIYNTHESNCIYIVKDDEVVACADLANSEVDFMEFVSSVV